MRRRSVLPAWLVLGVLAVVGLAACYDPPRPACGFRCGAGGACPADYTCGADSYCHLVGSPAQSCGTLPDARPDADLPPMVVESSPPPGAVDVPVNVLVQLRFSEDVVNVDASTIVVSAGTAIDGAVDYGTTPATAIFQPAEQLPANTLITVSLSPVITDLAGMRLAGPTDFTFTTGPDTVAPAVFATMPSNGDSGILTTTIIDVFFDEPVTNVTPATFTVDAGGPIAGTITLQNGGRVARFAPDAPLPAGAQVTVTLTSGITDAAGNALPAETFTFTTAS